MEGNKQKGTCPSFTSELFGSKQSHYPSPPSGIFESIFSPPSTKVLGREQLRAELNRKMANESWCSKIGIQDPLPKCLIPPINEDQFSKGNESNAKDDVNPLYQEQRVVHPCQLSSSIYYGGQDLFINPPKNDGFNSLYNNEYDDREFATRGDWWQGSLYY